MIKARLHTVKLILAWFYKEIELINDANYLLLLGLSLKKSIREKLGNRYQGGFAVYTVFQGLYRVKNWKTDLIVNNSKAMG